MKQPQRDQQWPCWALGHDGEFPVLPLCTNFQASPPCCWQSRAGGAQRALGSPEGLWGAPGDAQLEQTQPQARKGDLGRASQLPAAGEFQPCTRESWKPPERGSNFTCIRMFYFSPASDEFELAVCADNPDLKQLYLESRFHCRHSCCMTDATVLSQHCFQCLQQLHSIPLPDTKCTFILINGKKINLWGK